MPLASPIEAGIWTVAPAIARDSELVNSVGAGRSPLAVDE